MILLQKTIPVSPNKIWKALTKLKQMQKWYFKEITDFRPEVGFETSFAVVYRKKIFTHQWLIYDVLPQYRIAYYWQYLEYEGMSTVSFELEEVIQGTKVTLKSKIIEPFPKLEEFSKESMENGWKGLIENRLTPFLVE